MTAKSGRSLTALLEAAINGAALGVAVVAMLCSWDGGSCFPEIDRATVVVRGRPCCPLVLVTIGRRCRFDPCVKLAVSFLPREWAKPSSSGACAVKSHPAGGELNRHEHCKSIGRFGFWSYRSPQHCAAVPSRRRRKPHSKLLGDSRGNPRWRSDRQQQRCQDPEAWGIAADGEDYRTPLIRKGRAQEARSIDTLPAEPQAIRIDLVRRTRAR